MSIGYENYGSGSHKVVVLHGWFGDETFMRPMRDALSGGEFTYIFPAYRGYGASKRLTGAYTVEEIAGDVIALADKLGLDRFSLVGHSMGGKFIQRVALDAPARVDKMVAVTPVPAAAVPFDDQGWGLFSAPRRTSTIAARSSTSARDRASARPGSTRWRAIPRRPRRARLSRPISSPGRRRISIRR